MSKSGSVLLAFLAGAATGAALGILYAPDEGRNTRDKLSYQLSRYRDRLQELVSNLRDGEDGPLSMAKAEGQKVIADTKQQAEKLLSDVEQLIGQIKDRK
jgi:gas vesicle protein